LIVVGAALVAYLNWFASVRNFQPFSMELPLNQGESTSAVTGTSLQSPATYVANRFAVRQRWGAVLTNHVDQIIGVGAGVNAMLPPSSWLSCQGHPFRCMLYQPPYPGEALPRGDVS
jgi:hypothetical protein